MTKFQNIDSEAIVEDEDGTDPGQIVDINNKGVTVKCKKARSYSRAFNLRAKKKCSQLILQEETS